MAFTLTDSGSYCLLVDDLLASKVPKFRDAVPELKTLLFYGCGDCPSGLVDLRSASADAAFLPQEPDENDIVGLFYTSGTTGGPKGVMLSHRNLYSNAVHALMPPGIIEPDSRFLHAAPMFHLADVGAILLLTLTGASHSFLRVFDPEGLM